MKHITYFLFAILLGLSFWACEDDNAGPVAYLNGPAVITAPTAGTAFVLTEANASEVLPDFTWTAADFGYQAGAVYKLEMDLAGNNFGDPVTLANINSLAYSGLTQADLNNILLAKELEGEVPADIELRVTAIVNAEVQSMTSDVVVFKVTPYTSTVVIPQLQVPGSYQGWDPANNTTIIFSPKSNGQFEGFLYISPDNALYKFTDGPSWDKNWGDTGADGTLDQNGADIPITTAGVYRLNADINGLTHSHLRTDWGLIGSATPGGWDSDQDMTFDQGASKFTITLDLIPGLIKFRANDGWDVNFGDNGNNKTLEYNGADINVAEAGNYTIDLLIIGVAKYKYTITKN